MTSIGSYALQNTGLTELDISQLGNDFKSPWSSIFNGQQSQIKTIKYREGQDISAFTGATNKVLVEDIA